MLKTVKQRTLKKASIYVSRHREHLHRLGVLRVEVAVRKKDADLVRKIASTLRADGDEAARLRAKLQDPVPAKKPMTGADFLAELAAIGPLLGDEVVFERSRESSLPPSFD